MQTGTVESADMFGGPGVAIQFPTGDWFVALVKRDDTEPEREPEDDEGEDPWTARDWLYDRAVVVDTLYGLVMEGGSAADQLERIYALLGEFGYRVP